MGSCYNSGSDRKINELSFSKSEFSKSTFSKPTFSKSICTIVFQDKTSYGFLIKLFKGQEDFFCLMTSEYFGGINLGKFLFYFGEDKQSREILLDSNERIIEDLRDFDIDETVIEILPKDNIPMDYFLLPNMDIQIILMN
jgi:hypothetical protein